MDALKQCAEEYDKTDDDAWKDSMVHQAKMWGRFSLETKDKISKL